MRRIWVAAAALTVVLAAADARGDTLYLKDGQSVWGKDIYEEGDSVVVVRPGGDLRFPKSQVDRIERTRTTLPPFYSPPTTAPAAPPAPGGGPAGAPGGPPAPGAPPATGGPSAPPAAPGGTSPPAPAGESSPATPPPATGPTQLPPPPAPPPLGG